MNVPCKWGPKNGIDQNTFCQCLGGILGGNSKDSKALRFIGSVLFTRWTKLLVPLLRLVILIGSDQGCRHRILRLFPEVQTGHHRSISPKRDRQITFQRTQPSHSVWHCPIDLLRNDTLLPWGERAARCGWKLSHPTSVVGDEIFLSLPMFSGTHMHLGFTWVYWPNPEWTLVAAFVASSHSCVHDPGNSFKIPPPVQAEARGSRPCKIKR